MVSTTIHDRCCQTAAAPAWKKNGHGMEGTTLDAGRRGGGHWAAFSLTPGFLQIEVGHGKKAIAISVPVPLLGGWHRSQQRITRELEKKFSDRHVLIIAPRRILPRPKRSNRSHTTLKQKRPRSRTLTAVHDAILTDLVYPVEIVGKRVRTREDGSKILKVVLDEKERGGVDYRLDTYSEVYKRLTGKGVNFEFPQHGDA